MHLHYPARTRIYPNSRPWITLIFGIEGHQKCTSLRAKKRAGTLLHLQLFPARSFIEKMIIRFFIPSPVRPRHCGEQ